MKNYCSKKIILLISLLVFSSGVLVIYDKGYHPAILMYHSISYGEAETSKLVVTPLQFERQMKFLKDKNYRVISLEELTQYLITQKPIPSKTVVLTFDDGYENNFHFAYPVLKKYGFTATVFLVTDWIEKSNFLTWRQIQEMEKKGIQFGNHTLTHPHLPSFPVEKAKREILDAQKILQRKLKRPSSVFCYPFGGYSKEIQDFIKEKGFKAALATSSDGVSKLDDLYAFRRVRISNSSNNLLIFWIETSGYYSFIRQIQKKIKRFKKYVFST